jgi:coproporphyrinogen III oxidase
MESTKIYKTDTHAFREEWINFIHTLQDKICSALEIMDGKATFITDEWQRLENRGGGGTTKVITDGNVFEKGGVNSSVVYGKVTPQMRSQLKIAGDKWFACGISIVIHPLNPYVPTVHANWRYFEMYDEAGYLLDRWFGGGTDLTPYYIFEEDGQHFHHTIKSAIDPFGEDLYAQYKKQCDEYFRNSHRHNEARGIGGIFYDYLRPDQSGMSLKELFAFQQANGNAFLTAYLPIVEKRKDIIYSEKQIAWQEYRRGRYVEFNLIHDRGTLFGLKTNGRTESILMSLPPRARWIYNYQPEPGTPEAALLDYLQPREWV